MNNNLDKLSWELVEVTKDMIKQNITSAVSSKQLDLNQDSLPKLFSLIDTSTSEAYSKSHKSTSNKFEKILDEEVKKKLSSSELFLKKRK